MRANRTNASHELIGNQDLSIADLEQVTGGKGGAVTPAVPAPTSSSLSNATLGHILGAALSAPASADPVLAHVLGVDGTPAHGAAGTASPVWVLFGGGNK